MPGLDACLLIPSHLGPYPVQYDVVHLLDIHDKERPAGVVLDSFECKRCSRYFTSRSAREQHWEASGNHFICLALESDGRRCAFDGDNVEHLLEHYLVAHGFHSCRGCLEVFVDFQVYLDHLDREFACPECNRHHDSENNVEQHMIIHLPRDVRCWACPRDFSSISAMLLHLETGCPSGVNCFDLNQYAASFVPSWKFVDPAYRLELASRVELALIYPEERPSPFTCPEVQCRAAFTTLSGLLQHVENGRCFASLTEGILAGLMTWLQHKVIQKSCAHLAEFPCIETGHSF